MSERKNNFSLEQIVHTTQGEITQLTVDALVSLASETEDPYLQTNECKELLKAIKKATTELTERERNGKA